MNYLAHAFRSLEDPYFTAGTAAPDWLSVVDRRVRLRAKRVEGFRADADPLTAAVAAGVLQHLRDDARFHAGRAFAELTWQLTGDVRRALEEAGKGDRSNLPERPEGCFAQIGPVPFSGIGFQPGFLAHLLVEVLLDAALTAEDPARVQRYYQALAAVDPRQVEAAVNRMVPRPTAHLAFFIGRFLEERILWDYLEDGRLMRRLNQVMRRVNLPALPESFAGILPEARRQVAARKAELLGDIAPGGQHPGDTGEHHALRDELVVVDRRAQRGDPAVAGGDQDPGF